MMFDWGDGNYDLFASSLVPAAQRALDVVEVGPGVTLVDVGCGSGNVTLEALSRGARVTAADPSPRLVEITRRRAEDAGHRIDTLTVDAAGLGALDADCAVSVFAVIFASDGQAAVDGLVRSTRPGGQVALTSWCGDGAVAEIADVITPMLALPESESSPQWNDAAWICDRLDAAGGADITVGQHSIVFRAESPQAWLDKVERHHPFWLWVRRSVSDEEWDAIHADSLRILESGNDDPTAFAATAHYHLVGARRER